MKVTQLLCVVPMMSTLFLTTQAETYRDAHGNIIVQEDTPAYLAAKAIIAR